MKAPESQPEQTSDSARDTRRPWYFRPLPFWTLFVLVLVTTYTVTYRYWFREKNPFPPAPHFTAPDLLYYLYTPAVGVDEWIQERRTRRYVEGVWQCVDTSTGSYGVEFYIAVEWIDEKRTADFAPMARIFMDPAYVPLEEFVRPHFVQTAPYVFSDRKLTHFRSAMTDAQEVEWVLEEKLSLEAPGHLNKVMLIAEETGALDLSAEPILILDLYPWPEGTDNALHSLVGDEAHRPVDRLVLGPKILPDANSMWTGWDAPRWFVVERVSHGHPDKATIWNRLTNPASAK